MIKKTVRCPDGMKIVVGENMAEISCHYFIEDAYAEIGFEIEEKMKKDAYVLFPACCYRGNQFRSMRKNYPPLFTPEEAEINMETTITDVPRLNEDGTGRIEITTGDVSVPCVAVFHAGEKKAVFVYTVQQIEGDNLGLCYESGIIWIQYPKHRKKIYRWPQMHEEIEKGIPFFKEKRINIPFQIYEITCRTIEEFYKFFLEHRKCMGLNAQRAERLSWREQFEIQKEKFNKLNWAEKGQFYSSDVIGASKFTWQPGWVGGAITTYPLMKLGTKKEWERSVKTLEHLFRTQAPSGFFYERTDEKGTIMDIGFDYAGTEQWHLIRKSGDVLYFLFRHFELFRERNKVIPEKFLLGAKKVADAFVRLWEEYGQFGQFVDLQTGKMVVGGSTCGAIVPAALTQAYRWFGNEQYLEVSKEAAELYYRRDALKGYTTGAPEEILQCPDSESAFALLESMVILYETVKEEKWLEKAEYMAALCSSWVVSYNYLFPEKSEFRRLGMKTVGTVFANIQNKHSAPGICTLSGDSLYKLYQWTGKEIYLELCKDIALSVSQYMSTEKRPIIAWDVPKDSSLLENGETIVPRETLPPGYICERVNMSDWEGERCVGGVFNGSCWSETTNLLVMADLMPLLEEEAE